MNDLTEFQQRACAAAVVKMFNNRHFDICTLQAVAETMGRKSACGGKDYEALRAIHCVEWGDMGPDLARMTREKCLEILGLPPQTVDEVSDAWHKEKDKPAGGRLLKLAFWR